MTLPDDTTALAHEPPRGLAALLGGVRRRKVLSLAIALGIEALLLLLLTLSFGIAGREDGKETVTEFAASDYSEAAEPEAEQAPETPPDSTTPPVDVPPVPDRPNPLDLPEQPRVPITSNPAPAPPPPPPAQAAPSAPKPAPTIGARINPNRNYGPADSGPVRSSMDSQPIGTAPNGEPLYAARWYREPTHQELAGYLSTATSPGVALIACRTVAGYYVEDCVLLGESPQGAGLGRAVMAAAWQFRVRPARLGGREQFGTWVQIRITYSQTRAPR